MVLPTKHLHQDKALLSVGAEILNLLNKPKTVSRLWDDFKNLKGRDIKLFITFDWFILAIDLLYTMNTIESLEGKIWRTHYDK